VAGYRLDHRRDKVPWRWFGVLAFDRACAGDRGKREAVSAGWLEGWHSRNGLTGLDVFGITAADATGGAAGRRADG